MFAGPRSVRGIRALLAVWHILLCSRAQTYTRPRNLVQCLLSTLTVSKPLDSCYRQPRLRFRVPNT